MSDLCGNASALPLAFDLVLSVRVVAIMVLSAFESFEISAHHPAEGLRDFRATRLRECLSRNTDTLSAQCQQNYLGAINAIQKRINARATVANACSREIVKLCNGSTKETSKSVPCMITAKGVSRNCIQAMDDAGYR